MGELCELSGREVVPWFLGLVADGGSTASRESSEDARQDGGRVSRRARVVVEPCVGLSGW